jgi:hypothetical protein
VAYLDNSLKTFLSVSSYSLGTAQVIALPIHPTIDANENTIANAVHTLLKFPINSAR